MQIPEHSTREMFDRYNVVNEDDNKAAINKLEGRFKFGSQEKYKEEKGLK